MTETFPGYEDYSTKYFEEMIKRFQEEEAQRVEAGVKACKLDLCFAVNEWMSEPRHSPASAERRDRQNVGSGWQDHGHLQCCSGAEPMTSNFVSRKGESELGEILGDIHGGFIVEQEDMSLKFVSAALNPLSVEQLKEIQSTLDELSAHSYWQKQYIWLLYYIFDGNTEAARCACHLWKAGYTDPIGATKQIMGLSAGGFYKPEERLV